MRPPESWPSTLDGESLEPTHKALEGLTRWSAQTEAVFRSGAKEALAEDVRALLRRRAEDHQAMRLELQAHQRRLGAAQACLPLEASAAWSVSRTTLPSHADRVLLEQCEGAEDALLEAYTDALAEPLAPPVQLAVQMQRHEIRRQHELLRNLRDRLRGLA